MLTDRMMWCQKRTKFHAGHREDSRKIRVEVEMFWPQLTTRYLERKEQGRGEVSVSFPVVQQRKELPTMALGPGPIKGIPKFAEI
jgi:hypothetical protein